MTETATLRVHDGVLYERDKSDVFWFPATDWVLRNYHKGEAVPRARVDPSAPILCDCGSTAFHVRSPTGEYETSAQCVKCGQQTVVHDG